MKKLISKLKDKSRRGFTVAEVVVALTIIVLVSGASVLTFATQARVEAKTAQTFEATNIAENAIECFIYSPEGFKNTFEQSGYILSGDGTAENPYTVTKGGVTVTITLKDNNADDNIDTINTIEINATNANGENILQKTVSKQ